MGDQQADFLESILVSQLTSSQVDQPQLEKERTEITKELHIITIKLQELLKEHSVIQFKLANFDKTKHKEDLEESALLLKKVSLQLKEISNNPLIKHKLVVPLFVKLTNGMQKSIKKAKILSNTVKFSTESGTYNKLRTRVNSYIADTSNTLNNGNPQIPQPLSSPQISPQFVIFDSIDRDFSAEMVENENFDAKSLYDFNQNPKPLQGMLKKRGNSSMITTWNLRFCRQHKDKLFLFKTELSEVANGHLRLTDVTFVQKSKTKFGFDVVTPQRVYQFQALSNNQLNYWINGIHRYQKHLENQKQKQILDVMEFQNNGEDEKSESEDDSSINEVSDDEDAFDEFPDNKSPMQFSNNNNEMKDEIDYNSLSKEELVNIVYKLLNSKEENYNFNYNDNNNNNNNNNNSFITDDPQKISTLNNHILNLEYQYADLALQKINLTSKINQLIIENENLLSQLSTSMVPTTNFDDKLIQRVTYLENEVREYEALLKQERESNRAKNERILLADINLNNLNQDLNSLREELKAKDSYIAKLSNDNRKQRSYSNPAKSQQYLTSAQVHDELTKLRESIRAHQSQNLFLSSEISRIEKEHSAVINLKDETIKHLRQELDLLTHELQLFKQNQSKQNSDIPASELLDELDKIKKELFYALGVGIKLNLAAQGYSCNIDLPTLYEESQHINFTKWKKWIQSRLQQSSQKI